MFNRRTFLQQAGALSLGVGSGLLSPLLLSEPLQALDAVPPSAFRALTTRLRPVDGVLLARGEQAYEIYRRMFNLRLASTPLAILVCKSERAIVEGLAWAKAQQVAVYVRSGGHAYEPLSTGPGLLLDLGKLDTISIDPAGKMAYVGPGVRLGALTEQLARYGLATPTGTCPTVGMAGLALGGGYGMLSRRWGLTCDQLLAVSLISARGERLIASDLSHRDLFWACKGGGGGQFAVATGFIVQVHALREVWQFEAKWPRRDLVSALKAWQAWAPNADDGFTSHFVVGGVAGGGIKRVECGGFYTPTSPEALPDEGFIRRNLLSMNPSHLTITRRPYLEGARLFGRENPHPVYFKAKSDFSDTPLSEEAMEAIEAGLAALSAGEVQLIFSPGGGAVARTPVAATAYPHRDVTLGLQYYASWQRPEHTPAMLRSMQELYEPLRPYFSGRAYVNYADLDLGDWQTAYFRENLERLKKIKQHYDPEGVFNARPQAIHR